MNIELSKRKDKILIIMLLLFFIISLVLASYSVLADDDDDDDDDDNGIGLLEDDLAKDIGYISIGLYGAGMINVIVLYFFKFTRRFLSDEGRTGKIKNATRNVYLKTRKPLNFLHYLLTLAATTIITLHGIEFIRKDQEVGIFGWVSVGIFLLYILTGAIIKLKIQPLWTSKGGRKVINKLHRSLLILLIVIAIHIVHFLLAD